VYQLFSILAPLNGWLNRFLAERLRVTTCMFWWREYFIYFSSIVLLHTMEFEIVSWYRRLSNGDLKSITVPLTDVYSNDCTDPNRLRQHGNLRNREMETVRGRGVLGAFAKFQEVTISVVMSACQDGTLRLLEGGCSGNLENYFLNLSTIVYYIPTYTAIHFGVTTPSLGVDKFCYLKL